MKLGEIYLIKFLDHSCFSGAKGEPITCEVVGRISKISKKYVDMTAWRPLVDGWENNNEGFCVIRSCIIGKKRLR